nr:calcium-binding protein [Synechococcus sp. HK05]
MPSPVGPCYVDYATHLRVDSTCVPATPTNTVAFTTQEGTGGAPWTFQGTPEADSIAVITGNTQNTVAFDFIAEGFEGDDTINFNGTRSVTIKGGQGADVITNNVAVSAGLTNIATTSFINGNDGDDRIGNTDIGLAATLSTISGGQGSDDLYIGSLQSSKINGNLGADFILAGNLQDERADANPTIVSNFNAASIFGGQGDDAIRFQLRPQNQAFSNSIVNGQLGNDFIQIQAGQFNVLTAAAQSADRFNPSVGIVSDPTTTGSSFNGGDGNDIIDASGALLDISRGGSISINNDNITNGSGSDLEIFGGDGQDSIFGGGGEDFIDGGEGNNWLAGYAGRDEIVAGAGDDLLIGAYFDADLSVGFVGDAVGDVLTGGTGSNRFFIPGSDAVVARQGFLGGGNTLGSTGVITLTLAPTTGPTAAATAANAVITNGDFITVSFGADVITDWNAGSGNNVLDTGFGNDLQAPTIGAVNMSLGENYNQTGNFAVRGFYSEVNATELGQFVVNQNGTDIAVWTNYDGGQFISGAATAASINSSVNNFTILRGVSNSVTLTANEFVAV